MIVSVSVIFTAYISCSYGPVPPQRSACPISFMQPSGFFGDHGMTWIKIAPVNYFVVQLGNIKIFLNVFFPYIIFLNV